MSEFPIPLFASVGGVNTGKTSTIATLIEDSGLRMSPMPGTTTSCQRFDVSINGRAIIGFYDTPGFQNARRVLHELQNMKTAAGAHPLDLFRDFVKTFEGVADYSEECKLFRPILEGAGIIYVVDASQPFRSINDAEMEILRMTGQPRLGLINCTGNPTHKAQWEGRLGQHFNLVREFNAHTATYFDRIELLKTLAGIKQDWRPALDRAIQEFKDEWDRRLAECAERASELLIETLGYRETAALHKGDTEAILRESLVSNFEVSICKIEGDAHEKIVRIFKHSDVELDGAAATIVKEELFSDRVWLMLGLDENQLTLAAIPTGAAAGLAVDAGLGFHSLGLGAIVGAAIGASSAFVTGKVRPTFAVKLPGRFGRLLGRQKVSGSGIQVGPVKDLNFPWILLDRLLAVYYHIIHRAHARQKDAVIKLDEVVAELKMKGVLSQSWENADRSRFEKIFGRLRAGKATDEHRQSLQQEIKQRLHEIAVTTGTQL